ncbi:hypothetical protein LTS08_003180 [Lithohypha guttulata]|uniref:Uncharacterized protein n=1 Tax=Lithohypha guttulata TaxID=1690604 RepID=A0AAN7SYV2_9EURO|nr:hypothetical protein LTR51_000162 [Lithohypha guttulata]KAK5085357.1 hypothetical protein LTR05_004641 [Lithohypha guttulata]KAK5103761.1 hypothetical protein LTS08_003180 [Lithohypha guttulata]
MDKLKAIFRRKKQEPGPSKTAGTRTEAPNQVGTSTQVPPPTTTTSSAAPSSSQPVAPAGAAPITTESSVDNSKPADPTPGAVPSATQAGSAQQDEAVAVAAK